MDLRLVERELSDPEGGVLAASIFGHTDGDRIGEGVATLCERALLAPVAEIEFFTMSVGAVFGLRLDDGRGVVLKIHLAREEPERLSKAQVVQRTAADAGFPCPRPIEPVSAFEGLPATFEELVRGGEHREAHDPEIRRTMAATLAWLVRIAPAAPEWRVLGSAWHQPPLDSLWPEPHNALFDFERTASGAEWIDRLAERARQLRTRRGRLVVCHADWSVKHFRFRDGRVHAIYDWDSLRFDVETTFVGTAAVHFPYTEAFDVPRVASLDEIRSFVAEYEDEGGKPFTAADHRAIAAAAAYSLAYTARCEHALDPGEPPAGSYRAALAEFGDELLG